MSFPFSGKIFTFTQPDGSIINVRGWGDQHYARFETLDGYPVVENPLTNFYEYASLERGMFKPSGLNINATNADLTMFSKNLHESKPVIKAKVISDIGLPPIDTRWKQRREEAKMELTYALLNKDMRAAPPQRKTVGTYIGLCLLIDFPDEQRTIDRDEVAKFCNEKGYNGYNNNGSVRDYFLDNSLNKLDYTNMVTQYYTAKQNKSYYTDEHIAQPIRAIELIEEALDHHIMAGFNFGGLTTDAKNYVFAINVYYAGPCVNNWARGLWPHAYRLTNPKILAPGIVASDYQITNMGHELTLGTFCHENGHMICDFPDLYDYGYESSGVGNFCLMCGGGNADAKNPVHINAYLKYRAGWANSVVKLAQNKTYQATAGTNDYFIISKNRTEYYIIENRKKEKRDNALPDEGLSIWHIDEFGDNSNEQMTPIQHYECSLVQADGKNDLENGNNDGDTNDLFKSPNRTIFNSGSAPKARWWDGSVLGIEINQIGAAGNSISFAVS